MTTQTDTTTQPSPADPRGSSLLDPQVHGGPMRLSDLVEGYWALTDAMYDEIQSIYAAHMRGEKIDIKGVEARLGRPLNNQRAAYVVQDGVAIISLQGVIGPKANLMMDISGGASAQMVRNEILTALADPKVKSGILYTDSPGGNVLGIAEGAQAWAEFAREKPAVTFSDGTIASAAYWWGSAAPRLYISGPMVNVGSIGARTEHVDTSMRDAASGVKRTIIKAGRYKAAGDGPLDPKTLEYRQAQVDYLYTLFVDAVAANRGASVEQVLEDMADGRVFVGQQAIDAGLVDGFSSLEELVAQMADDPSTIAPLRKTAAKAMPQQRRPARAVFLPSASVTAAGAAAQMDASLPDAPVSRVEPSTAQEALMPETLTRESIERDHAALFAQLRSEFLATGATDERARIQAVLAQSLPGHEALVQSLAFDGKTTGEQAAVAVLQAERQAQAGAAAAHFNDAPNPAPSGAASAHAQANAGDKPKRQPDAAKAYAGFNRHAA